MKAAVVVSNPWNLDAGSLALQRTWIGREVYSKTMGNNMKRLFELHKDQIAKNPAINIEKIRHIKYLHEFDREIQGPTWGYPTEGAYYRDASSCDALLAVRIPFFAINAEDDPIAVNEAIPYEEFKQNDWTVLCTTSIGGHLSWFEFGEGRWHAKPCIAFLNKMAFGIDVKSVPTPGKVNGVTKDNRQEAVFAPMRRKLHVRKGEES